MRLKYRPLAVMGFSMLLILFLSLHIDEKFAAAFIAVGAVLFIISLVFKKIRDLILPIFLSISMLISGVLFISANNEVRFCEQFVGKQAEIVGTLTDKPEYDNNRYYYLIETEKISNSDVKVKLRLSLANEIDIEPYDSIKINAKIYKIGSSSNEIQLYYKSKGVLLGAYSFNNEKEIVQISKNENKPLKYKFFLLRQEIESRILDKLPNEYGGTVIGMLLGDKSFISDETVKQFREAGIAPLFAVSGLHLSIWVMGLFSILELLNVKKRINSIIGITFSLFFMTLTGFSPSVCRSGLMMILLLSANLFRRKADSVNSLGFSALVLCMINPFIAADTGFLLSFSATLGIITIYSQFNNTLLSKLGDNLICKIAKAVISPIAVSISATIGALPVTIFFIKYISIYTVLTNLLVTYAATVCMVLGGFAAITFKIGFLSDCLSFLSGILSKYIIFVVNKIAGFQNTTISTADVYWKSGVIVCLAVLIFCLIGFKGKMFVKSTAVLISASIVVCSALSYMHYDSLTEIRILNVENGIAIVAFNDDKKIVLGSNSDYYYTSGLISDNLNEISRKSTNLLVIPNENAAQSSSTLSLIKEQNFDKIITPYNNKSVEMLAQSSSLITKNHIIVKLWSGADIEYLCCDDYSLAYCKFDNVTFTVLFSSKKNADIDNNYKKADYLVCCGFIPYSLEPQNFKEIFVSSTEKISQPICKYVNNKGVAAVSTAKYGDIIIDIKNGKTKILVKED